MKLIVKDLKFQETSEILLKHFPEAPEEELVIYPEYTEKSGLRVLKCGNNVKIPGCSVLPGAWDGAWRSGERYFLLGDRVHEPAWDDVRLFQKWSA